MAPARTTGHEQMVLDLLDEWTQPASPNTEPIIFEEAGQGQRLAHVYVVWSRWADVDRVERSEIIMEAAERKLPAEDVLNITIAMGLTPDEAIRMGMVL
jgi:hypothetical protein